MSTLIVVPMKDPAVSKSRLSGHISDAVRARLARLLYDRTLAFLKPIADAKGCDLAVVTGSRDAARRARQLGVSVIVEPFGAGLSDAVHAAALHAVAHNYRRLCVIPADLAAPLAHDLERLLSSPADITICPSLDMGTNALLVSPPLAIPFCYGPQSALRHQVAAEARGITPVLMPLKSLSFDVDTSNCLRRARADVPAIEAMFA